MSREVLLYSASWCPDCRRAVDFLDEHGIVYTTIDIDLQPHAADELERETGKRGIPFLKVDGEWVRAYDPGGRTFPRERLEQALGLA